MTSTATALDAAQCTASTVALGEIDLYFTDWNGSAGRTVLLIHGINVQGHTWDPIARELAKDYRVICPDLRGHGRSSWTEAGYWASAMADDLVHLMRHLGIDECDVVGHSLGARVAVAFAAQWPGKTHHLILSDGGPEVATPGLHRGANAGSARRSRQGFSSPDEALVFYQEAHPEWEAEFISLHIAHQLKKNWAGKLVERSDPELVWLTRGAGKRDTIYLWECAERLDCRTLLLWGERSAYFDEDVVANYHRRFGGVFSDRRCDAGHYIPREMSQEFTRLIRDFLAEQSG
ncbi:pimeloyl-ACP methyl ester carboxylesterase [Hephaestia caeni]|uniref:Pimeloyl-ACP methyl ester carboxylesterase n=1 Tax=Hephaestia caeni TaxID=645617 RepID=A0A397PE53_9SPHN|nr:alpha/beta hydrolase [Hephaestia caeni]RIA45495.1 pimeloyl-ACP methyl ester carboxylesterase [Hephaestia caeni]